jgi:hypothetical protein
MPKPLAASQSTVKLSLYVPETLLDAYAERAAKLGHSVEDELLMRLRDCAGHTAQQGIYLDDVTRQALAMLAARTIKTPADVLEFARKQTLLKVGGVDIVLSPQLADRLRSRCFGKAWDEHIREVVIRNLEVEVGLR